MGRLTVYLLRQKLAHTSSSDSNEMILSTDVVQSCTTILIIHEGRLIRRYQIVTLKFPRISRIYCRNQRKAIASNGQAAIVAALGDGTAVNTRRMPSQN